MKTSITKNSTPTSFFEFMNKYGYVKIENICLNEKIFILYKDINNYLIYLSKGDSNLLSSDQLNSNDLITSSRILQENISRLAITNRSLISALYDEIKNMPSFLQLVTDQSLQNEVSKILNTSSPRVGKDSLGMRIDLDTETNLETGGIDLIPKSHKNGAIPLTGDFDEEIKRIKDGDLQYAQKASSMKKNFLEGLTFSKLLSQPGDIYLIDYFTIHRTRLPLSKSPPRLTVQARYYDPCDDFLDWKILHNKSLPIKHPLKTMSYLQEFYLHE
ncbi:MAG: hypothetical protein VYB19_04240 [Bacteroidota bacterium]|nr:hypothetical protein [Bacteroidota bacterium]